MPSGIPAAAAISIPASPLAEVDAAAELERGLEVVVDDELGPDVGERPPERDDLGGRRPLQPQLDDGRPAGRRAARRGLVGDECVQPHGKTPCD